MPASLPPPLPISCPPVNSLLSTQLHTGRDMLCRGGICSPSSAHDVAPCVRKVERRHGRRRGLLGQQPRGALLLADLKKVHHLDLACRSPIAAAPILVATPQREPAARELGLVGRRAPVRAPKKATPAGVLLPLLRNLIDGEGPDAEFPLPGDVHPEEALVGGQPHAGEALVVVNVQPADADVEVAAKDEADGGGGQDPVVGQDSQVVAKGLRAGQAGPAPLGAHCHAAQRDGLRQVEQRH
mmetsp:Transcript_9811/g.28080  ORF Transcript_9811/g.28080 Transcript_9811/m.28080 type:complete len:241 (+) Transcript_9811:249-971(+)